MGEMEEWGIVLDYLPRGKSTSTSPEPLVQILGYNHFTILEAVVRRGVEVAVGEKVYVGKGERNKIDHIKGRISYYELTGAGKAELDNAVERIVKEREADFVNFFNKCGAVTIRLHQLELLPGIGKKHMGDILREREKRPFTSFADIKERVALLPDPTKLVRDRILTELRGESRYYILTRPPYKRKEG